MMRKVTKEEINAVVEGLTESNLLKLWNEVADNTGDFVYIHEMEDFDDVFYGVPPIDIVRIARDNYNFDPDDDVFTYDDCCECLESFHNVQDVIDVERLIDEIYDKQCDFDCSDLVVLFESVEEECKKENEALMNRRAG